MDGIKFSEGLDRPAENAQNPIQVQGAWSSETDALGPFAGVFHARAHLQTGQERHAVGPGPGQAVGIGI